MYHLKREISLFKDKYIFCYFCSKGDANLQGKHVFDLPELCLRIKLVEWSDPALERIYFSNLLKLYLTMKQIIVWSSVMNGAL